MDKETVSGNCLESKKASKVVIFAFLLRFFFFVINNGFLFFFLFERWLAFFFFVRWVGEEVFGIYIEDRQQVLRLNWIIIDREPGNYVGVVSGRRS